MSNIQINASVSKTGLLTIPNSKRLQQDLKAFSGSSVEIIIRKKNRRSNQQSRYYWGVVVKEVQLALIDLGNPFDPETVHEFLKDKFNKKEIVGPGGEVLDYFGSSTATLNAGEFSEYVERIAMWASEMLGITIPAPNQDLTLNF
jgi:hypothetical protein